MIGRTSPPFPTGNEKSMSGKVTDVRNKIGAHLREHKELYITSVTSSALTAAAMVLVLSRPDQSAKVVQKIQQIAWRPENSQVVISLVERSTPSKPVHLVGTNLYFDSLSDAARKTGHSLQSISQNVNGHISSVGDDVFELLQPA